MLPTAAATQASEVSPSRRGSIQKKSEGDIMNRYYVPRPRALRRRALLASLLTGVAAALCTASPQASAQAADHYPDKPIRLIVPFTAGGGTDVLARLLARSMSQTLGGSVVVENVTGAGGVIGAQQVARANPDGYTLMIGTPGSILVNPIMQPDLGYHPFKDFVAVSQFSDSPVVVTVNKDTPWHSIAELIQAAKDKPGAINYGSAGVGTIAHFSAAMFEYLAHVKMTHVPYRGTSMALTDLRAGRLQVEFENMPGVLPLIKDGQLRALAMGSAQRSSLLPELPTLAESGVPGYESTSWTGIFAPAKTPPAVVARIEHAVMEATRQPDVVKTLHDLGCEPVGSTSKEFLSALERRRELVEKTVKATGMTAK
jgi:tripartite-type tricarboxylate transporter receptor subunit TctC